MMNPFHFTRTLLLTGLVAAVPAVSFAQDALGDIQVSPVIAPEGFTSFFPGETVSGWARDGFNVKLRGSTVYDSNVGQGSGLPGSPEEGDLVTTIAPSIAYKNPGGDWKILAEAGLNYSNYLDHSELSGLGGNASVGLAYEGAKAAAQAVLGYSRDFGVNRYYGSSFVERDVFDFNLNGSYRLSPKTSFDGSFGYRWDDPDQAAFGGTQSATASVAAMWRYSPLLRVGPGLRYRHDSGDRQPDRHAVGPLLRANYQVSSKVVLDGSFGLDFVEYSGAGGTSDEFFFAQVGLNYRPSIWWGFNLSLLRDAQADPLVANAYRETLALRAGATRRIRRATLATGIGYEMADRVSTTGGGAGGDMEYFVFDTSLSMPVFRNRSDVSVYFRWRDQSGSAPANSWNGYQIGLSLSTRF